MTWFKVDDQLHDHRKRRRLGKDQLPAMGLWLLIGSWCADTHSDGFVPLEIVQRFDPKLRFAKRLVDVGLWQREVHDSEHGYRFHDWNEYQPTKVELEAIQDKKSSGGQFGNHTRWHVKRHVVIADCPYCNGEPRPNSRPTDRSTDRNTESEGESQNDRLRGNPPEPEPEPEPKDSPSPSHRTSPLAGLGLTEREIKKTVEYVEASMSPRNLNAALRALIKNGDIHKYVDQAKAYIADDQPRIIVAVHHWNPDTYGAACTECPMPKDHGCHQGAAA